MKMMFRKLHKRYPWLDSIISLLLGAIIGYLFQELMNVFRTEESIYTRLVTASGFCIVILLSIGYYSFGYPQEKKPSKYEKEKDRNLINQLENDRKLMEALTKAGIGEIAKDNISFNEKCAVAERIHIISEKFTNLKKEEL